MKLEEKGEAGRATRWKKLARGIRRAGEMEKAQRGNVHGWEIIPVYRRRAPVISFFHPLVSFMPDELNRRHPFPHPVTVEYLVIVMNSTFGRGKRRNWVEIKESFFSLPLFLHWKGKKKEKEGGTQIKICKFIDTIVSDTYA